MDYSEGSDPENLYNGMADAFSDKAVRMGFIRKVYGILCAQLTITFGIVAIFVFVDSVQEFAKNNIALFWSAFGITIALIIVLACCGNFRRKTPWNFIALFVFTICEGYLIGCTAATYEAWQVSVAVATTVVVTLGLTLFAFQTKYDFTTKGGLLFVLVLCFMMFGIFAAIFRSDVLYIMYACLGALLFSAYIVFDTQLIIGGKHKVSISPEEYVFAALNLYLDVVNLFLYILAIFGGSSRS